MRYLIVDDDKIFSMLLKEAIEESGASASVALDVQSAQAFLEEASVERLILDLKMPGQSGLTLIPWALKKYPELKIVVLTGHASIETTIEAIKLGAIYYLSKPVEVEAIFEAFAKTTPQVNLPVDSGNYDLFEKERLLIQEALVRNQYNISQTARELGLHRRTLQRKMAKFGFSS